MTLFLTHKEIVDLTGYEVAHYQALWFESRGYPLERTNSGKPRVLRAFLEKRLGLATEGQLEQTEPDFSHWKK
jgi:hypothetical protein